MSVRTRQHSEVPVEPNVPVTRTEALVGGTLAALVAGLGILMLRSSLDVRSVPERLMEWLLLFMPPGVFEGLLQRFGFDAKRYGLDAAILLMLGLLAGAGYAILRAGWRLAVMPLVGLAFWLFIMLVIMPVTSAGFFALDLEDGKRAAIGGYLAVGLSYAAVLAAARALIPVLRRLLGRAPEAVPTTWSDLLASQTESMDRRVVIGLLGSAGVAYAATYLAALILPKRSVAPSVLILDPQEPVPSGGLDLPNPHPQAIARPENVPTQAAAAPAPPSGAGLAEPPPQRHLERDKDGAVVRSARKPGELAAPITGNSDFYVVTKNAAGDPTVHPQDWRLLVDGEVARTFQLDYATLRKLPAVEVTKTLECISNFVGKPELAPFGAELISTAKWKGARVSDILNLSGGVKSGAEWLAVLSADEYTTALPMQAALDPETLLVYDMNGEVLPREHGYPARILAPGRYGMKNPKWVIGLRPMRREFADWYGQRNWSKTGIVQTMTRIDSPAAGAAVPAGSNTLAGIAYAGSRGIRRVEFSPDGGSTWREAQLLDPSPETDRWVRWQGQFSLPAGTRATLLARATDGTGAVQEEAFRLPEPDGGTGWPSIEVRAAD